MVAASGAGHPGVDRWDDIVNKVAPQFSVPPNLVKAHMLYESGGDPSVISGDQGCGLMQITYGVVEKNGVYLYGGEDILDPEYNVTVACRDFISKNIKAFPDNLDAIVAAYNAGIGAVQNALAAGRNLTKVTYDPNYIANVTNAYAWLCKQDAPLA